MQHEIASWVMGQPHTRRNAQISREAQSFGQPNIIYCNQRVKLFSKLILIFVIFKNLD